MQFIIKELDYDIKKGTGKDVYNELVSFDALRLITFLLSEYMIDVYALDYRKMKLVYENNDYEIYAFSSVPNKITVIHIKEKELK